MTPIPGDQFNLAVGQPGKDLIPTEKLNCALKFAVESCIDPLIYQYPSVGGPVSMRTDLVKLLVSTGRYPTSLSPEELRITYGNSHGLSIAIQALTKPGENVIVEDPTYFLSSKFFSECHVNVHPCPAHSGLDIDVFESMARELKPSLVYVNPIHHNPTGTCLSQSSREKLIQLSAELGFVILSDEPYVLLSFSDTIIETETSLATTAERIMPPSYDRLVCFGSFSKIIAPGLRCGWMSGKEPLLRTICASGALVSGGSPPPILVEAIRHLIVSGSLQQHIQFVRDTLKARKDQLVRSLQETFRDNVVFHPPTGGYFVYVHFAHVTNTSLLNDTHQHRLKFLPGEHCSTSPQSADAYMKSCARLAFSFYTPEELHEAIIILAQCHAAHLRSISRNTNLV